MHWHLARVHITQFLTRQGDLHMELISLAAGLLTSASIGFSGEDNHAWESKAHQCWYMERLNQLGLGERDDVVKELSHPLPITCGGLLAKELLLRDPLLISLVSRCASSTILHLPLENVVVVPHAH
jgi:hypothetical protein